MTRHQQPLLHRAPSAASWNPSSHRTDSRSSQRPDRHRTDHQTLGRGAASAPAGE
eukprot:CAMPEP_0206050126 /NCGR_PEP_ID=MMETSP1466-20131121/28451_1 /ASSEMBLY_ACC=CAM_ASM_001126 /TAXON_ID=44452 /ORGANISM="Pavlova gyrans, Strain CCMP608" /LENGTH=54 /DNA_ID=CAMNT_0053425233 /DNA_START=927 /DNA_END=1088 /DNA_ORIENTATION=+